jgi:hypothetical protein
LRLRLSKISFYGKRAGGALLLVFALPQALANVKKVECKLGDQLKPEFTGEPTNHCTSADECLGMLTKIKSSSEGLRSVISTNCNELEKTRERLSEISGQENSNARTIELYSMLGNTYEKYGQELSKAENEIKTLLGGITVRKPLVLSDSTLAQDFLRVRRSLGRANPLDSPNDIPKAPDVQQANNNKQLFALRNGYRYYRAILEEKKQNNSNISKFNDTLRELVAVGQKYGPPGNPGPSNDTKGPGNNPGSAPSSGLNPNTLMGLATAATGLAGLLNKSVPPGADATSPTPESLVPEKPVPNVTKFDSGKAVQSGQVGAVSVSPKVDAPSAPIGSLSGESFNDDSDVSKTPEATKPPAAAMGKSPGGSGGGGTEGGGANEPPAREPASVAEQKEDDLMQGIGGGGLGGGGSGGFNSATSVSTDPGVAAAEDSMKDLLTEMKETAETGLEGEASGNAQASGMAIEMGPEDLFPRVRAAHVRSLKQGNVLNGLGEKITEDIE